MVEVTNPKGRTFYLYPMGNKTEVRTSGKSVMISMDINSLLSGWYKWQQLGAYIQHAFPELPADEREYLLTGITPIEWARLFPGDAE